MLQPKKTKYRRPQKGRMKKITKRGSEIAFGSFALKTLDQFWISARQIEAARQAITREMKRQGQLWIRIFPDRPVTAKGLGVRMGKGKGTVEYWVAPIQPGRVLFEIGGITEEIAREAFRLAAAKLSVTTTFVRKQVI